MRATHAGSHRPAADRGNLSRYPTAGQPRLERLNHHTENRSHRADFQSRQWIAFPTGALQNFLAELLYPLAPTGDPHVESFWKKPSHRYRHQCIVIRLCRHE